MARVTISDVARHAGVSKGAVSYALNNRPGVAEATRQRILAVASELGWRPSHQARALSSRRAYALGFVLARQPKLLGADPFFPAFIAGVETVLSVEGQSLVLQVVSDAASEEAGYRRLAEDGRVDGVFLADLRLDDRRIGLLQEIGLPAVTLNRPRNPSPFPAVCLDAAPGCIEAVQHLVDLGHQRIAHVGGPAEMSHSAGRREAWEQVLEAAGLDTSAVVESDFTAEGGAAATRELLARDPVPTAIVYANDLMAIAGMHVAADAGLRLPQDLSITGFDDVPLAAHVHPPLTTVSVDAYGWGQEAARVLLANIETGSVDEVRLPPARFVPRASVGPPPA